MQASSVIEDLKMGDLPAKKLEFTTMDKENIPANMPAPIVDDLAMTKPIVEAFDDKRKEAPTVVPTVKPQEAEEPLLQENPHRFVLFPIKYHEVIINTRDTRKVLYEKIR